MKVKLTTLTPLHIGTGEVIRKDAEFLVFSNPCRLAIIDPEKVLNIIGEQRIQAWTTQIENGQSVRDFLMTIKRNLQPEDIAGRILPLEGGPGQTRELRLQLQNHLGAMIPGSSLKGAMRTVLFNARLKQSGKPVEEMDILKTRRKGKPFFTDKALVEKLLARNPNPEKRNPEPHYDIGRFIQVSDAVCPFPSEAKLISVLNYHHDHWRFKDAVSHLAEVIRDGETAHFTLKLDFPFSGKRNYRHINPKLFDVAGFLNMINQHTLDLLKEEQTLWEVEREEREIPGRAEKYIDRINQLLSLARDLKNSNACIMRMAYGSGWSFMTGSWAKNEDILKEDDLYDEIVRSSRKTNRADSPFPKTRKMTSLGEPLGFVKLDLIN